MSSIRCSNTWHGPCWRVMTRQRLIRLRLGKPLCPRQQLLSQIHVWPELFCGQLLTPRFSLTRALMRLFICWFLPDSNPSNGKTYSKNFCGRHQKGEWKPNHITYFYIFFQCVKVYSRHSDLRLFNFNHTTLFWVHIQLFCALPCTPKWVPKNSSITTLHSVAHITHYGSIDFLHFFWIKWPQSNYFRLLKSGQNFGGPKILPPDSIS